MECGFGVGITWFDMCVVHARVGFALDIQKGLHKTRCCQQWLKFGPVCNCTSSGFRAQLLALYSSGARAAFAGPIAIEMLDDTAKARFAPRFSEFLRDLAQTGFLDIYSETARPVATGRVVSAQRQSALDGTAL